MNPVTVIVCVLGAATVARARILFPYEEELLLREGLQAVTFNTAAEEAEAEGEGEDTTEDNGLAGAGAGEQLCGAGEGWCAAPRHYPDTAILAAVTRQKQTFSQMFDSPNNTAAAGTEAAANTTIGTRSGNFEMLEAEAEFTNICAVRTSYITPRAAKNKEGQFRFIVNSPDGAAEYSQLVRVAVCGAAGAECSGVAGTRCRQEYSDHKLVSLGSSGEELVVDTFSFPSCCTCLLASTDLLL